MPPADQQQQPPECPEAQTLDSNSGQCVPVGPPPGAESCPEGQCSDPTSGQCVPDANLQQQQTEQELPVGLKLDKYDCPSGFDAYNATYEQLIAPCGQNQNPVSMTLRASGGQNLTEQITAGVQWFPHNAGFHQIIEQIPEGYGEPIVYCGASVSPSVPAINPTPLQDGNGIIWELLPGEFLSCQWFNVQTGGEFGRVLSQKFDCQEYDFEPDVAGIEAFQNACQSPRGERAVRAVDQRAATHEHPNHECAGTNHVR